MGRAVMFAVSLVIGALILEGETLTFVPAQPLNSDITNTDCGKIKLCLATPKSCNPADSAPCLFASIGYGFGADLTFKLSGNSSGYIALGVSTESSMQNGFMFACGQMNGSVFLVNTELVSGVPNQSNMFPVSSVRGSVVGNIIKCTFSVSGLGSLKWNNGTQISNLYVFLATGSITSGVLQAPQIQLNSTDNLGLTNISTLVAFFNFLAYHPFPSEPLGTNISRTDCGKTKLCVATPASCNLAGSSPCLFASVTNSLSQDANLTIELRGDSSGFVAVGGNLVNSTLNSVVFACGQQNGNVFLYTLLLQGNILPLNNLPVTSAKGSVSGNVIQCSFQVVGLNALLVNYQISNIFSFLANGSITNGILQAPVIQLSPTNLSNSSPIPIPTQPLTTNITNTDCGKTKLCLGTPKPCDPAGTGKCLFASFNVSSRETVAVELQGESSGYVAVGLSTANSVQNATMFACAQQNGNVSFYAIKLIKNLMIQENAISVDTVLGSVKENILRCTFNAVGLSSQTVGARASDTTFSAFLGIGNINPDGTLQSPNTTLNLTLVDLSNVTSVTFLENGSSPVHSISALLFLLSVVAFQLL